MPLFTLGSQLPEPCGMRTCSLVHQMGGVKADVCCGRDRWFLTLYLQACPVLGPKGPWRPVSPTGQPETHSCGRTWTQTSAFRCCSALLLALISPHLSAVSGGTRKGGSSSVDLGLAPLLPRHCTVAEGHLEMALMWSCESPLSLAQGSLVKVAVLCRSHCLGPWFICFENLEVVLRLRFIKFFFHVVQVLFCWSQLGTLWSQRCGGVVEFCPGALRVLCCH